MVCPPSYVLVREGKISLCVPNPELYRRSNGVYEPSWAPVFYNPHMVENRDISIAVLNALNKNGSRIRNAVDPMTGSGVRGIRFAVEVDGIESVYMGDIDEKAVELAMLNAKINNVVDKVMIEKADCRELLYKLKRYGYRMDYIDIDPFGSPAPFVQAALECVRSGGIVGFTATDLAPLEGKYPKKLFRRYGVIGTMCGVPKEIAIRNLLAFVARMAAMVDRITIPLYSYSYRHYIRVYVTVSRGKNRAYEMLSECIGAIHYCNYCGYWEMGSSSSSRCPICEQRLVSIENTWICHVGDATFAKNVLEMVKHSEQFSLRTVNIAENVYSYLNIGNVLPYRISFIARYAKKNMPKIREVIMRLKERGYKACRVEGYHDAIATDAPISELIEIVNSLS